jgi:ATP-dependent protease ClpP protease subunit
MSNIENLHDYNIDVTNRTIYFPQTKDTESVNQFAVASFCKNLDYLTNLNNEPINIQMYAVEGGCWYSGMVMYEYIKNCPCQISIYSYSLLCSMGTIILQAADTRYVSSAMQFMVHFGSTEYAGEVLAVRSYAEFSKNGHNKMIDIYAEKCQHSEFFSDYTPSKVKSYLRSRIKNKGDWWMDAEEAVKYGFADTIITKGW